MLAEYIILYIVLYHVFITFTDKFPPVVLQSQIYSLITDHTKVDTEVNTLRVGGQIAIIKLDSGTYALIDKTEYIKTGELLEINPVNTGLLSSD